MSGGRHRLDFIVMLITFCAFAASVLIVLMFSGIVYKDISDKAEKSYEDRTGISYVWSKVKNGEGGVYVGDFQGISVLCLEEESDMTTYLTMIYLYDGWVRELVSEEGLEFSPSDGMPVVEAETLYFTSLDGGLIKVTANSGDYFIYPRVSPIMD